MAQLIAEPVYLGDERDVDDPPFGHDEWGEVVTLCPDEIPETTKHFPIADGGRPVVGPGKNGTLTRGTQNFIEAVEWLLQHSGEADTGPILVHCRSGVNRSPSVVAAWYALEVGQGFAALDALMHVKHQRKIVSPAPQQLAMFGIAVSELRPGP
jgi:protein-tyrosine phosphatase